MRVGDCFSGIGGFSLAAEWMGWSTAFFSEIDPFASRVLAHHWPDVPNLGDITRIDWTAVEPVDVLTGGFPCQPHSLAGKRLASSDSRDLFGEIIRAVRVLRPQYLVLENVRGLLTSESGRFFGRVLGSLAECGYDAEWRVLSAADVGAFHRRERIWIVAYCERSGWRESAGQTDQDRQSVLPAVGRESALGVGSSRRHVGDPTRGGRRTGPGLDVRRADGGGAGLGDAASGRREGRGERDDAEPAHAITRRAGVFSWSDAVAVRGHDNTVRRIPRDAAENGIESRVYPVAHGIPARVAQLRGLGNAIVPQCAYEIFRDIEARDGRVAA